MAPQGQFGAPVPAPSSAGAAPTAVKVLVGLMIAHALVGLINIPLAFSKASDRLRDTGLDVGTVKSVAVVTGVILGALYVALALVLLRGKKWAWIVALVLVSLGVLGALATLGGADNRTALTPVAVLLLLAIFVLLLVTPTRHWVGVGGQPPAGYGPGYPPPGYPQGGYPQQPGQPGWGQPQQPGYAQQPPPSYPTAPAPGQGAPGGDPFRPPA